MKSSPVHTTVVTLENMPSVLLPHTLIMEEATSRTCLTTASLVPKRSEVTLARLSEHDAGGSPSARASPARPVEASPTIATLRMKRLNARVIRLSSDAGWKSVGLA